MYFHIQCAFGCLVCVCVSVWLSVWLYTSICVCLCADSVPVFMNYACVCLMTSDTHKFVLMSVCMFAGMLVCVWRRFMCVRTRA